MASYETIRTELDLACILLQQKIPDFELDVVATEWSRTLAHMPDAHFSEAMRRHRKRSGFFPGEHDIERLALAIREEEYREAQRSLPLPEGEETALARCEYNAAKAKAVLEALFSGALPCASPARDARPGRPRSPRPLPEERRVSGPPTMNRATKEQP